MSHRPEQVSGLVRDIVGRTVRRELELPANTLVTVTHVQVGPAFKHATVFLTVTPNEMSPAVFAVLRAHKSDIQDLLASELSTKFTPRLSFRIDTRAQRAEQIENLLDTL